MKYLVRVKGNKKGIETEVSSKKGAAYLFLSHSRTRLGGRESWALSPTLKKTKKEVSLK